MGPRTTLEARAVLDKHQDVERKGGGDRRRRIPVLPHGSDLK